MSFTITCWTSKQKYLWSTSMNNNNEKWFSVQSLVNTWDTFGAILYKFWTWKSPLRKLFMRTWLETRIKYDKFKAQSHAKHFQISVLVSEFM